MVENYILLMEQKNFASVIQTMRGMGATRTCPHSTRNEEKLSQRLKKNTEDLTKTIEGLSTSKTQEKMHFNDDSLKYRVQNLLI